MLKNKLTKILIIGIIIITLICLTNYVYAGTSSISVSNNSVKVGDTITVTISANAASWNVNLNSSGPVTASSATNFSNVSESGENEDITIGTVTYTATGEGTVSFSLSGQLVDGDYNSNNASGNATVTVVPNVTETKNEEQDSAETKKETSTETQTKTDTSKETQTSEKTETTKENETPAKNETPVETKPAVQTPTVTEKNETLYSTGDIYVRSSYSASSNSVGSLKKGDEILVTGILSNGWSRVKYNGETAYIRSDLLTEIKPEPEKSNNKALKSLKVEKGTLEPKFNKDTTNYELKVGKDVESLKIEAEPEDEKAKVTISGNEKLQSGNNTIKVTVTAEDETVRTYVISVSKEAKDNLQLSKLEITGAKLSEVFSPTKYSYSLNLSENSSLTKLDIKAEANNKDASVEILGNENFIVGENVVTIILKSKDGEENVTYQIIVNKPENSVESLNTTKQKNKNDDTFLYVAIGIFATALLLIIIIIVRSIKKSKNEDFDELEEDENNYTEELYGLKQERESKLNSLEKDQEELEENKFITEEDVQQNNKLYDVEKEVDFSDEEEKKPKRKGGKHSR